MSEEVKQADVKQADVKQEDVKQEETIQSLCNDIINNSNAIELYLTAILKSGISIPIYKGLMDVRFDIAQSVTKIYNLAADLEFQLEARKKYIAEHLDNGE